MKKEVRNIQKLLALLITVFLLVWTLWESLVSQKNLDDVNITDNLKIHFIDVGQGDATFIELPNEETLLIDAGEEYQKDVVKDYITDLGYEKIDYVIGTHPHTDHIGALANQLTNFEIGKIYLPKVSSNTLTYENLLKTIQKQGKEVYTAQRNRQIINGEDLKVYFLGPISIDNENLNNSSAILKIVFKDNSFLFMGDAETKVESQLNDVEADVIKVGHHGSDTSSSKSFVSQVNAKYAIISVGKNNQYNHPSSEVIKRWEESGANVYRTDECGNIVVTSDGHNLKVEVEKNASNS